MRKQKDIFISPTDGELAISEVVDSLISFTEEDMESNYRLIIGSDSRSGKITKAQILPFITAIVIHRKGKGGRYYWQKKRVEKIGSMRDKIYMETLLSIQLAEKLVPQFTQRLNGQRCQVEIHIDVGDHGPTREMLKEVVGMVNGNGFKAKTKPSSFGASTIADKHT